MVRNASLYSALGSYVELEGYYLESDPCSVYHQCAYFSKRIIFIANEEMLDCLLPKEGLDITFECI